MDVAVGKKKLLQYIKERLIMIMVDDEKRKIGFYKKKILFVFGDYPKKFSKEEKDLFNKENPSWKELLGG